MVLRLFFGTSFFVPSGTASPAELVVSADISGAGGLFGGSFRKDGTGSLQLTGHNTYGGRTYVNAGTLKQGVANAVPPSACIVAVGATLDLAGFASALGSLSGAGTVDSTPDPILTVGSDNTSTVFAGNIQGNISLQKVGDGDFTLSGDNTYTGPTIVMGGMISLGSNSALPSGPTAVGAGTALDLNGNNANLGSLSGDGKVQNQGGPASLTTGQDGSSTMFNGTISGQINLVKTGPGKLSLGRQNTYSGSTQIT
jgi:autotransporter-associated beta strand protein